MLITGRVQSIYLCVLRTTMRVTVRRTWSSACCERNNRVRPNLIQAATPPTEQLKLWIRRYSSMTMTTRKKSLVFTPIIAARMTRLNTTWVLMTIQIRMNPTKVTWKIRITCRLIKTWPSSQWQSLALELQWQTRCKTTQRLWASQSRRLMAELRANWLRKSLKVK